jgi:RNA polymerase sigma factor (sigma-70 family)
MIAQAQADIDIVEYLWIPRHLTAKLAWRTMRREACAIEETLEYSYGVQALMKAQQKFDASIGVSFATYAHKWVQGAIIRARQRIDRVDQPVEYIERSTYDDTSQIDDSDHLTEIRIQIRMMPEPQREFMYLILEGYSVLSAAEEVGICSKTAYKWYHQSITVFRSELGLDVFNGAELD